VNLADLPPDFRFNDDSSGDAARPAGNLMHTVGLKSVVLPPVLPLAP